MRLIAESSGSGLKLLTYSSDDRQKTKKVCEKWSIIPGKIIGKEHTVADEDIKEYLKVDNLDPLYEPGVESSTSKHHGLYKKFVESLDFFVSGRVRIL